MKCLNDETILKYLCGLLSPQDANSIAEHIVTCSSCEKAVETEKKFDLAIKKELKEDYRFARLSEMILAKAHRENRTEYKSLIKWFAITGGMISALAVFNSFALLGLILYLNDFSISRIVLNVSEFISIATHYFSIYSIWLNIVSATLYAAVAFFGFTLFFARKTILKAVKI